ncbi:MAG TPA: helix-turn-helix transcriptional regulator [Candidatus Sulfotelmatobacter sp.]|nr:helix-turn-helix transcriptional regulator [Candidatus Sulfotelmatobacter sp.]
MRGIDSRSPPPPASATHFGALLREWRAARRVSQLDLALAADISSRHLSCVETGRAQPSRKMVSRLAAALAIPLPERNVLLVAAGYAPGYRESGLAAPELERARRAIELILRQQEPYPAIVVSQHWDLLAANQGAKRLFGWMLGGPSPHTNIMRLSFDPAGLRPFVVNWEAAALDLVRRLHGDIAAAPSDTRARALLCDILAYPGVPPQWHDRDLGALQAPLSTITYRKDGINLTFFWTITTFGTPQEVTLEELRIECSFPTDEPTDRMCRDLAAAL